MSVERHRALLESGESLTELEKKIFALMKQASEAHEPKVICRAAGGWVRDKLLGKESDDLDFALENCSGLEFANYLKTFGDVKVMQNPEQSQHLDSAKVRVFGADLDMCQLRCDEYLEGSRIPVIRVGTPQEDVTRRDFTVNCLYFNVNENKVEDLTTGIDDLTQGVLRTPVDPFSSFEEDPLRILRAFRFGPRFGFTLDEKIIEAAHAAKSIFADKVTRPRMEQELSKALGNYNPVQTIEYFVRSSLFGLVFDHTGQWNLNAEEALKRVTMAVPKADSDLYAITLAAIYGPLLDLPNVSDPVCPKKKIPALECAIVRHICASADVYKTANRALTSVAGIRDLMTQGEVTRVTVGKWLRLADAKWKLTSCLLYEDDQQRFFSDVIVPFVEREKLEGVWSMKPLINGKDLAALHGVKPGPQMTKLIQDLIEWQLENPTGTADDYRHCVGK